MIRVETRLGVGLDIEYNETLCYVIVDLEGKESYVGYIGMLIKIPFFTIYLGDFFAL